MRNCIRILFQHENNEKPCRVNFTLCAQNGLAIRQNIDIFKIPQWHQKHVHECNQGKSLFFNFLIMLPKHVHLGMKVSKNFEIKYFFHFKVLFSSTLHI